jgi:uncharacterized protein
VAVKLATRRWIRRTVLVLGLGVLGANAFAYVHARALTRFGPPGPRMLRPEELTPRQKLRTLLLGAQVPRPINHRSPRDVGLDFTTVTIPSSNGVALEAWVMPNGQSAGWVLLFHGYSESKQQMLPVARRFHGLGFGVVAVDLRASGGSTGGDRTTIGYVEAEDVAASVRWAKAALGAESPILYGFSMGGAAVLRAVGRLGVRPGGLIVESAFDRMLSTVENRFAMMGVPAFPMARLLVFWGGVQGGFPGLAHNPADYAAGVLCPALLIHGEKDERVTVAQARSIFDQLRGPKDLRVVPGVGHEASEAMSDDDWRAMVAGFLQSGRS